MKMFSTAFLAAFLGMAAIAGAQSLSIEELQAQIDERVNSQDPYRALLNNPDPIRSRAAAEIMLDSGDLNLMRMAANFAIRSPEPSLQRLGVEGILRTGVPITVALDGSNYEDWNRLNNRVTQYHHASVSPEGIAYIAVEVGEYDAAKGCFLRLGNDECGFSVNGDGLFLTHSNIQGRFGYGEDGIMSGAANTSGIDPSFPATIRLTE